MQLCHVDDFTPETRAEGRELLTEHGSEILSGEEQVALHDFSDANPQTHHWEFSAFERVAKNKQQIFDKAVREKYDYVWILDTDLLLDPYTLYSLYSVDRPVVAAVYWTKWQADDEYPAGPQVWLRHPYRLDGRGQTAFEFRRKLIDRQLVRVWGLGACMLLKTDVLQRTRYSPLLPDLVNAARQSGEGMLAGEDRTFSLLCERSHIEMWGDAWPDIYHVYRPQDADNIDYWLHEFRTRKEYHPLYPTYGDYVNLQIVPLEDANVPARNVRGRLGALGLVPELEDAVLNMQSGDRRLLRIAFPADYPISHTGVRESAVPYAGHAHVCDVHMIDHKPFYPKAPVVRDELVKVGESQEADIFRYTQEQIRWYRRADRG